MPAEHVQKHGRGTAVLMNLSPQWYNAFRVAGAEPARKREVFMRHLTEAGVAPRVRLKESNDAVLGSEITYWSQAAAGSKPARTILFLCQNPEITGNSLGGGNSAGLKTATLPVTLQFAREVQGVRDERTGKEMGKGREFAVSWKQNEAVVLSFLNE